MFLKTEELSGGITLVHLVGHMDTAGTAAVHLKMRAIADEHRAVVINLAQVSYLASMGVRTFAITARTIASKGGRVACFGANENVARILRTSGVASLLPVLSDQEAAIASVTF